MPPSLFALLLLPTFVGGHSHNDYKRDRPLTEALAAGMASVEADVFLVDGELRVGHERRELRAGRTLESMYLEPLLERFRNRPFPERPLILLIDIKADGARTYAHLKGVLPRFAEILSEHARGETTRRHVTVVLSGARPRSSIEAESRRLAFVDGGISDLERGATPDLTPVVSEFWFRRFRWLGVGEMPEEERRELVSLAERARSRGVLLRFWGAPDGEKAWGTLAAAGVGLINTDRPTELGRFLVARR